MIDPKGGTHSLARRIEGATAKDVRARMADVDVKRLPSVADGKAIQYARHGRSEPVRAPSRRRPTQDKARAPSHATRQTIRVIGSVARPAAGAARAATGTAGGIFKAAEKALDGLASAFESLLGGGSRPAKDESKTPLDAGAVPPRDEIDEAVQREQEEKSARRAKYLQKFSREVPDELQHAADLDHDKKGRERTRGNRPTGAGATPDRGKKPSAPTAKAASDAPRPDSRRQRAA